MLPDFDLNSYNFDLPEKLIAQFPTTERTKSRLLVFSRKDDPPNLTHTTFEHLAQYLPKDALLVANNCKVLPARLSGKRDTGGKVEFLLLTPIKLLDIDHDTNGLCQTEARGLIKMGAKIHPGLKVTFSRNLQLEIIEVGNFGHVRVRLTFKGDLSKIFEELGSIPLPPYIKRPTTDLDQKRYQTVYAASDKIGAVAAPTAGLHFTPELKTELENLGLQWAELTLYVGYGTFSPVRSQDIREHQMHSEYVEISEATAQKINQAKEEGRPIIAVGTTSVRALEGAYQALGSIQEYQSFCDIFLYPGKPLQVIDGLITNFHLPKSSLLMLIASFVGREKILKVYQEAISLGYRFFSYGDAMLILP